MTDETYIERSDRAFCDFCSEINPIVTWSLPEGQRMNMHMQHLGGQVSHDHYDSDGKWTACQTCNEEILRYKKSKVKPSALRSFVKSLLGRSDIFRGLTKEQQARVGKELERHQRALMGALLPLLGDPKPFVPAVRVFRAEGTPSEIVKIKKMRDEMNESWERRHGV